MIQPHYSGLSDKEVAESRKKYGVNILTPPRPTPLWRQFLDKFRDPLIIILCVAGVLSVGISIYEYSVLGESAGVFFEPTGIFIAILLATGLAFAFEVQANREFALLNQVNDDEPVQVIRNGIATSVPKKEVVVGDIVIINTGEEIPADGILLEAISLNVDESTLTGEPVAHKSTDPSQADKDATFPTDHVMRGTKVMEGHGIMRVEAVGDATENGRVFVASQIDNSVKTPLNEQLDRLGTLITRMSYTVAALVVAGRVIMYLTSQTDGFEWLHFIAYLLQTFMIAVTLVVVAVPEGLPMAVTLSLAYSMRRMLHTNNLVRRMHACETMGATTVICTDKTGTLTQNRMQVAEYTLFKFGDDKFGKEAMRLLQEGIAVNSTARLDLTNPSDPKVLGNPTEGALLLWLNSNGIDFMRIKEQMRLIAEIPFSTERKYMATVVEDPEGKRWLHVKGAPEIVYSMCRDYPATAGKENVDRILSDYQNHAMRTLAFACARVANDENPIEGDSLNTECLTFIGITAIADPVRCDVPDAVSDVINAGIAIKIVTGDTPATAKEIGRQIGLWLPEDSDRNIITGPEFEMLSDEDVLKRVEELKIIARARPLDKKRLVEALQANNEVVAVTGDGTNDAPALKSAHVGLSMGDGTSVAKEASDITIVDNSFSSIGRAVMWGRSLYQNIQRFVMFQMTVNIVACLIVLCGAFMGLQSPLTVTQMLWVNLIMDTFAAMALASLPPAASVMHDKPRPRTAFIINGAMWRNIIGVGIVFFIFLFILMWYMEHIEINSLLDIGRAPFIPANKGLDPYELSLFFTIFVFLQFWNMFNARAFATGRSALHLKGCRGFTLIALAIFIGQILIIECGGQFFNVVPLRLSDWMIIIAGTSSVLWIGELFRLKL